VECKLQLLKPDKSRQFFKIYRFVTKERIFLLKKI